MNAKIYYYQEKAIKIVSKTPTQIFLSNSIGETLNFLVITHFVL
jgi:hypothetical protein